MELNPLLNPIYTDSTLLLKELHEEEPSDDEDRFWLEFKSSKNYDDQNEEHVSTTKTNTAPLGQVTNEPKIQFTTPVKTEPKTFTLTQLKTDLKPEISKEITTDLESTLKQERFISGNIYRSIRSNQPKRYIDDYNNSSSEYIQ
ncbi:hypothetical protein BD770DRAFT_55348 [Pilaira anomala]|nr:hypothetical protein BD770DRAFT_55348 [Pilaira anomala]